MKLKIELTDSKGKSCGSMTIQPKDWTEATRLTYQELVKRLQAVVANAPVRATISHGERTYSIHASVVANQVFGSKPGPSGGK